MGTAVRDRQRSGCRRATRALLAAAVLLWAGASAAPAQESGWTGRLLLRGQSVEDRKDWLRFRQAAERRFGRGRRLAVGLVQVRRFGDWDTGLEFGGTLRPGGGTYLSLDGRVTPGADVVEDALLGGRLSLPFGDVVPSLGYRLQLFDGEDVHAVSPRLDWYRGAWLFTGELRVIRSAVETTNLAAIGRVRRRLADAWSARLGVARGEEDFLLGRPPDQSLQTLTTRSVTAGLEHRPAPGWSVRLGAVLVDADPSLDRLGGSLLLVRSF